MTFIFLGVALLPINKYIKAALLLLTLAASCIFYHIENKNYTGNPFCRFWHNVTVWDDDNDDAEAEAEEFLDPNQHFSTPYRELEKASLDVEVGACEVKLGQPCAELATADILSNFVRYSFRTEFDDNHASLFLTGKGHTKNIQKKNDNTVNLALNSQMPWDFSIDMGAASADLDFTLYRMENIEINGGACNVNIKLGDNGCNTKVDIDTGVANIDIQVPEGVDCEILVDSAITDKDFIGFEKVEKGLWRTHGFGQSDNHITLQLNCAVSNISVKRY